MSSPSSVANAAVGIARRLLAGLCLVACGCTVNGAGMLGGGGSVRYFENDAQTGRSVMIDAWGINVSTVEGDAGITVGRARRTYYLAGRGDATTRPATTQAAGSGGFAGEHLSAASPDRLRLKPVEAFDWRGLRPLVVRGRSDGFSVGAGAAGATVTAGIRTFDAVRLPADSNVFLFLRTDSRRPGDDTFHVKEIER